MAGVYPCKHIRTKHVPPDTPRRPVCAMAEWVDGWGEGEDVNTCMYIHPTGLTCLTPFPFLLSILCHIQSHYLLGEVEGRALRCHVPHDAVCVWWGGSGCWSIGIKGRGGGQSIDQSNQKHKTIIPPSYTYIHHITRPRPNKRTLRTCRPR